MPHNARRIAGIRHDYGLTWDDVADALAVTRQEAAALCEYGDATDEQREAVLAHAVAIRARRAA